MSAEIYKDWWQILLLVLETLTLFIFIYFVNKYTRQFKDSKDPYTIACFVFIILTVISKVLLRGVYLILKNCSDTNDNCRGIEEIANCAN